MVLSVCLLGACTGTDVELPEQEPSHKVNFLVTALGAADGEVKISYAAGAGSGSGTATTPGSAPFWSKSVTSDVGTSTVSLSAAGSSSDLKFTLSCVITVDDREVSRVSGLFSCNAGFSLRDLGSVPSAAAPMSAPAPSQLAAGCRFLAAADVSNLVSRAAGVTKPVLDVSGTDQACTYVIDRQSANVRVEWEPGGPQPSAATAARSKVAGLPDTAYFADNGTWQTLEVERKQGLFTVTITRGALTLNPKQLAVDLYKLARPQLA